MVTTRHALEAATVADGARSGLRLEPHFTTPEVHPYEEVEWETRDAVITDYRTGDVAFEQRDVEFPKSWSLNATTIVAQKYFRGTLGTPERERSVKHMIDRVADTVTEWGRKDGYFADDQSATTFNAELKHLLVHQKAAFNSPVWFNVGVEPEPQCSACQPWDAPVSTPDGLVPIGRLVETNAVGAKVFDAQGVTRIVAVKANGRKDVLRLHLKSGLCLDVTADHLVWKVTSYTGGRFVEAGTLKPGDQLQWHRTYSHGSGEITQSAIAEAALAGWLQSDGFVGQYDGTNSSLTIEAMTVTEAERAWVLGAIDVVLPGMHRHERRVETQDSSLDCRRTRMYGRALEPFIERWNLRTRGTDMEVPEQLFSAPLPVVVAYLRSVFQAEGYVSKRERSAKVGLDMISEQLVRGIQLLLSRFGIFSRVRFKQDKRPDRHGCWSLSISNLGDRAAFHEEIGFIDLVKASMLEATLDMHGHPARATKKLEIERIEHLGPQEVYDIQTESGEYLSGSLRVHNCFILSVEDTMSSILNWYVEEGTIFKGGSGSGVNLSRIRSSKEHLRGGGQASGPVSFMRGADASAGTIKSGGKTRRAAKMVILDVDHPDVEEFIWCKQREELKARALREAGFDMDLDGLDSASIQYQNANNSVRVTDDFMRAVEQGRDWELAAVTTGETVKSIPAADLMRQIAQAAWECADPGMQYDTTINDWHTTPNAGRINGSNPCFTGDSLVHTDKGLVRFDALITRVNAGESFGVYTHDATNAESPAERVELTTPEAFMITGRNPIVRLRFSNGMELRCTPTHKIFTTNRGYVPAAELTESDRVKVANVPTPAVGADWSLPISTDAASYRSKGDPKRPVHIPEKWSTELGHYLGWLVGDGSVSGNVLATIYGGAEEQQEILPRHRELLAWLNGDRTPIPSVQANGTAQLRLSRRALAAFFAELGVRATKAPHKRVPEHIFGAPREVVAAFLTGLFDGESSVDQTSNGTRYVGLGSSSEQLLVDVQRLLASFGIFSHVYQTAEASEDGNFSHERADGSRAVYPRAAAYQLRITGRSVQTFAAEIGFSLSSKAARLERMVTQHRSYATDETVRLVSRDDDGFELTYNLSEPRNHSYIVNGVVVRNCSEYMHLDNSACNLASLNLRKFEHGGEFDVESFRRAVEIVFTAQEILVGNSSYPTAAIGVNAKAFRQLGLGYANLGGLLMSLGIPYDSDAGRAWGATITALMTGQAYRTSVELAKVQGPFDGYAADRDGMLRVLRKHRDALQTADEERAPQPVFAAARAVWDETVEEATKHGVRNAQASVLAPTGCLVGGSLVPTERGLVRLQSLGDPAGSQWQDLGIEVATDEGPRTATQFYVNGVESVATVQTSRGYRIQGTAQHRIKVATPDGEWVWKRLGDVTSDDVVPLALHHLVGSPQAVALPPLAEAYWTGERHARAPRAMTPELAEFVGYFMGDGSLHARGIRLCVAAEDFDVVEHLTRLGKELFGLEARVTNKTGYAEVAFHSVRLVEWWEACGFAKREPRPDHRGKGWLPHIPDAVLHTNDPQVYAAFVRGLFEADGTVTAGYPHWSTTSRSFSQDVQSLLLALGYPTTRTFDTPGWGTERLAVLRVLNSSYHQRWLDEIGFIGGRKHSLVERKQSQQSARHDHIPVSRALVDRLAPDNDRVRRALLLGLSRTGMVSRTVASELYERTADPELGHLLQFFYDRVDTVELGEDELTYDLSVPDNVTYVANGFVSHNTIGLMMDCDTTGIEPDLGLVKMKKLVGGGSMKIVNRTVPEALKNLGYQPEQIEAIVDYIDDHATVEGAPAFKPEHLPVFDCAMGERSIAPMGHVRMMAAVQPWLSGAISKTVNLPESATVEDVEHVYMEGWRLGLKALAIYRDNCKVAQPLSVSRKADKPAVATDQEAAQAGIVRRRLPRKRPAQTLSFTVGDAEGYMTAGEYPGDGLGEIFVNLGKQGSTLSGVMDAFAISVSIGLQYGVPLEAFVSKFINMRFEPAGMTDDAEVKFASSIVDYMFRRLAIEYLPAETRHEMNIYTMQERTAQLDAGYPTSSAALADEGAPKVDAEGQTVLPVVPERPVDDNYSNAPMCYQCGVSMVRAGSCHCCPQCGTTSGCS